MTKGAVGALTASAPVLDTVLQRGSVDPKMNGHEIHLMTAIKLLLCTHSQMRSDRKQCEQGCALMTGERAEGEEKCIWTLVRTD